MNDADKDEFVRISKVTIPIVKMRTFESGATRDNEENKPDYEGFMHPLCVEAYGKYMNKHRKQSDGQLRDSDNWQKLFGEKHFDVCIKSAFRHFMDWWLHHRGRLNTDIVDTLCALLFNVNAYLLKILLNRKSSVLEDYMKKPIMTGREAADKDERVCKNCNCGKPGIIRYEVGMSIGVYCDACLERRYQI